MVIQQPSPYGATHQEPKRVIIHAMGEYLKTGSGNVFAPDFLGEIKLSAHVFICPNGDIIRCREDTEGAYHAKGYNDGSLGLEFLVPGVHDYGSFIETIKTPYLSARQYQVGVNLVQNWKIRHGALPVDRHSDVSPERKVDPGEGFPWEEFLNDIGGKTWVS